MLLASLVLAVAGPVSAATIVFDSSYEFSGGASPAGAAPWLRATFDDGGKAGEVTLTFEATNLVDTEFVSNLYFNLDPAFDPTQLVFGPITKVGSFDDPSISTAVDAFKADGDGKYDLLFAFATSGAGGGIHRFGAGESMQLTISGIAGLVASSFNFLSAPDGGHGPYLTAAHVQSIGRAGDSGWVTVPEPSGVALAALGAGVLGLAGRIARRRGKTA
jgi:hypothetical protein